MDVGSRYTVEDLHFLAGLLVGEGGFSIEKTKGWKGKQYYHPLVSVNMTDFDVVEWVADTFSLTDFVITPKNQKYKRQKRVLFSRPFMRDVLPKVIPLMRCESKEKQAQLCVSLAEETHRYSGSMRPDNQSWDYRRGLWEEMRETRTGKRPRNQVTIFNDEQK